jgi:hypothetical protein
MNVNILGTDYKIVMDSDEKDMPDNADGCCDHSIKEIRIIKMDPTARNSLGDLSEYKKKVLRHEIIHAFLFESGLGCNFQHAEQFGHDETMVDWFAFQFPKLKKAFSEAGCL